MSRTAPPHQTRDQTRSHNRELGRFGESCAVAHLVRAGMVVLDRNWRCELGELDLVLREGDTLVFCEVKARTSLRFGDPLEAVTPVKAARLRVLAERWVEEQGLRRPEMRIDIVGVLVDSSGRPEVEHVRAAC